MCMYTCTLRQGLSVCAPTIVNPLPGVPPTAYTMIVEKLLVKKYCEGGRELGRERGSERKKYGVVTQKRNLSISI